MATTEHKSEIEENGAARGNLFGGRSVTTPVPEYWCVSNRFFGPDVMPKK